MQFQTDFKKVLFLAPECPFPPTGGSKIRDFKLISLLSEIIPVEVACFWPEKSSSEIISDRIQLHCLRRKKERLWSRPLARLRPRELLGSSGRIRRILKERRSENTLLWVSRLEMAKYIPFAKSLGYQVIYDSHSVESSALMEAALSSLRKAPRAISAIQCSYSEARFCNEADAVVAKSDIDASRLHKLAPRAQVHVIPNSVDCASYESIRETRGDSLFFAGSLNFEPNLEGLRWFIEEILPRLRSALGTRLPRLVVAGAHPEPSTLEELRASGFEVHANPETVLPFLAEAAVVFIPLRSNRGTRLNILEAMASARAVVSTVRATEGLVLSPGYDIFIADRADSYTSALLKLLSNPELRSQIGARAHETVSSRYDWETARKLLHLLLRQLKRPD